MAAANPELLKHIKLAKNKKLFFAYIAKGTNGKLIVSKKKVTSKQIKEAKDELGGGTPITGRVIGKPDDMLFEVVKPPPGTLAAALKKALKHECSLNVHPNIQLAGNADDEEEVEIDEKELAGDEGDEEEDEGEDESEEDGDHKGHKPLDCQGDQLDHPEVASVTKAWGTRKTGTLHSQRRDDCRGRRRAR
jgi:hypothetical protein